MLYFVAASLVVGLVSGQTGPTSCSLWNDVDSTNRNACTKRSWWSSGTWGGGCGALDSTEGYLPNEQADSDGGSWYQMDLGSVQWVGGIVTQGSSLENKVFTSVKVGVSKTGEMLTWTTVKGADGNEVMLANNNSDGRNSKVENMFDDAYEARYVKIYIQTWDGHFGALRAGVMTACDAGNNGGSSGSEAESTECTLWNLGANGNKNSCSKRAWSTSGSWGGGCGALDDTEGYLLNEQPDSDGTSWYAMDLGSTQWVGGVVTQGSSLEDKFFTKMTVGVSTDRTTWTTVKGADGEETMTGNSDRNTKVVNLFDDMYEAQYVRIYAKEVSGHFGAIRAGVMADCPAGNNGAAPTEPPSPTPAPKRTPTPGPPPYSTKDSGTCCGGSRYQWGVAGKGRWDCDLEPANTARCQEFAVMVDGAGTTVQEVNGDGVTGTCFRKSDGQWKYNTANTPQVCTTSNVCYCLSTPDPEFAGDGTCGNYEDYQITCLEVSGTGLKGSKLKKLCVGNGCKYKKVRGGTCTHNGQSKAKVKCRKIANANLCSCMGCTPKAGKTKKNGKKKKFRCLGNGANRRMWPQ